MLVRVHDDAFKDADFAGIRAGSATVTATTLLLPASHLHFSEMRAIWICFDIFFFQNIYFFIYIVEK